MRAVIQRVTEASVTVAGHTVGAVGRGLCALVGVTHDDDTKVAAQLARRIWTLRIFDDAEGRTNLSAEDVGAAVLVVSQFTLYADTSRGRRPSFVAAAGPEHAEGLVEAVVDELRGLGAEVATGVFRASMQVRLVNDGPFTVVLDTPARRPGGRPE